MERKISYRSKRSTFSSSLYKSLIFVSNTYLLSITSVTSIGLATILAAVLVALGTFRGALNSSQDENLAISMLQFSISILSPFEGKNLATERKKEINRKILEERENNFQLTD